MIKRLNMTHFEEIKQLFVSVFTKEPWNDDWSDETQLNTYMRELIDNNNSLVLGFYDEEKLMGLAMGRIKHWYTGTEFYIDELCIKTEEQGKGLGTRFIEEMEAYLLSIGIVQLFLLTERTAPAYAFYKKNGFYELTGNVAFAKQCGQQSGH